MEALNMDYPIKLDLIPGLPKEAYRKGVSAYEGAVAHSTATPEATDEREAEYFKKNWKIRQAFPHFCVDWDSITQLADINYKCWASGNGNSRFVQVELCETKDPAKFAESYKRYVWLLAYLLKKKNLGVTDGKTLVSHDWVSKNLGGTNHVDPIGYLASHGVTWQQFIKDVADAYNPKPVYPGQLLKEGTTDKANTKLVQAAVKIAADGIFCAHTTEAVKAFQKSKGLQPDGIVGPKTWGELF
jgi:N-acetylmuramoyl-L-alanine amidase CwlA